MVAGESEECARGGQSGRGREGVGGWEGKRGRERERGEGERGGEGERERADSESSGRTPDRDIVSDYWLEDGFREREQERNARDTGVRSETLLIQ